MAIYVTENWEGISAEYSATDNMRGVRFVQPGFYHVVVDENVTTIEASILALNDYRIPKVYDLHPYTPWAYVKTVRADALGTKTFLITVNYEAIEDPLAEIPETQWSFSSTTEPIDLDVEGEPITNSAGEPPNPPLTEDFEDLVLRRSMNWESFDPIVAATYMGKINSDVFLGFPPGVCKIKEFSGEQRKTGPFWYWAVNIEVHIRWDGWRKRFEDKGMRELIGTKEVVIAGRTITVPDYQTITETMVNEGDEDVAIPITEPVSLDGEGKRLGVGQNPVYLEYITKASLPFNILGIA